MMRVPAHLQVMNVAAAPSAWSLWSQQGHTDHAACTVVTYLGATALNYGSAQHRLSGAAHNATKGTYDLLSSQGGYMYVYSSMCAEVLLLR
jgi:hypothetical protein